MFGAQQYIKKTHKQGTNNIDLYVLLGDSLLGVPLGGALVVESGGFDSKYQNSNRLQIYHKPDRTSANTGSWQLYHTRATPTINRMPGETVDPSGPFEVGIDQSLVYGLDQSSLQKNLAIIKVAKGGSMLTARTGADNDWVPTGGELYTVAIDYFIKIAIPKLYIAGYRNVVVKALIVSLGTNDCATARWVQASFLTAVPAFIALVRTELGDSTIPVYWGQVRTDLGVVTGFDTTSVGQCRTILSNCKSGGATPITGFNLIETWESDATEDGVHPNEASCLSRGAALAVTLIALGD